MKKLNTGIVISYNKNGNIKACVSIYDNTVTNKPLLKSKSFKTHASYQPLTVETFNQWANKHL